MLQRGLIKFTLDLDRAIDRGRSLRNDNTSNIIISPLTLMNTFAMIHLGAYGETFDEIMDAFDLRHKLWISYNAELIYQVFGRLIDIVRKHEENSPRPLITTSTAVFSQVRYRLKLESSLRRIFIIIINIIMQFEQLRYLLANSAVPSDENFHKSCCTYL